MTRSFSIALALASLQGVAQAACFDVKAPKKYPSPPVEMFLGGGMQGTPNEKESRLVAPAPVNGQFDPTQGISIPENAQPPQARGRGFTPPASVDSLYREKVYFFEPDGRGGRRVCRVEAWELRKQPGEPEAFQLPRYDEPSLKGWEALEKASADYALDEVALYSYDASGHLLEWNRFKVWAEAGSPNGTYQVRAEEKVCFIREDGGRLARYVERMDLNASCAAANQKNASYIDYQYWPGGEFRGSIQNIVGDQQGKESPAWSQIWRTEFSRGIKGEAELNAWWGLWLISGLPDLEGDTASQGDVGSTTTYVFAQPTPAAVALNPLKEVKLHPRIRVRGDGTLYEVFPANGGMVRRLHTRLDGLTIRDEKFKNGRLTKVVNDGLLDGSAPYKEDLAQLKSAVANPTINVPIANVRLRVYDVDASGKERLVAISWSKAVRRQPAGGRAGPLVDLYRDAKDSLRKQVPTEEDYRVRYTDTTGKELWRSWEAFVAATGYMENSGGLFPLGDPRNKLPPRPVTR